MKIISKVSKNVLIRIILQKNYLRQVNKFVIYIVYNIMDKGKQCLIFIYD